MVPTKVKLTPPLMSVLVTSVPLCRKVHSTSAPLVFTLQEPLRLNWAVAGDAPATVSAVSVVNANRIAMRYNRPPRVRVRSAAPQAAHAPVIITGFSGPSTDACASSLFRQEPVALVFLRRVEQRFPAHHAVV